MVGVGLLIGSLAIREIVKREQGRRIRVLGAVGGSLASVPV